MPSTSKKQSSFMKAVANNPKFAKRVGVSQKVGKDFEMADKKMGKYPGGGTVGAKPAMPRDPVTGGSGSAPMTPERREFLKRMMKQNEEARKAGERTGRMSPDMPSGQAKGGKIMKKAKGGMMADKMGRAMKKKSADTMGRAMKYAAGGLMGGHKAADGIAKKGKTKGMKPAMAKGGMTKKRYGGSC